MKGIPAGSGTSQAPIPGISFARPTKSDTLLAFVSRHEAWASAFRSGFCGTSSLILLSDELTACECGMSWYRSTLVHSKEMTFQIGARRGLKNANQGSPRSKRNAATPDDRA